MTNQFPWEEPVDTQSQTSSPSVSGQRSYEEPVDSQSSSLFAKTPSNSTFKQNHPWLSGLLSGATSVVRQPARALQQFGVGLSDVALRATGSNDEQIKRMHDLLQSGSDVNPAGWGAPPNNAEELGGIALQTAANLATPAALAGGPAGFAAQNAALSAGSAMENDGSATDVALQGILGGAVGYGLGVATPVAGRLIGEGMQGLRQAAAPVVEKVLPFLSNIPKNFVTFAKAKPELVLPKMQAIAQGIEAGDMATAESSLRAGLLDRAKAVYQAGKQAAQSSYATGAAAVKQSLPDAGRGELVSPSAVSSVFDKIKSEAGLALTPDEKYTIDAISQTVKKHPDYSFDGIVKLKQTLWDVFNGTEQGTTANRIAAKTIDAVDNLFNQATGDAMKPVNAAYREFKYAQNQIQPIWKTTATEDQARNFVASLENQAKGGSLDAMKKLEELGGNTQSSIQDEIKALKVARAFNWEKAPAGSRMRDDLIRTLFTGTGAAAGAAFGPAGAALGAGAGAGLGVALTSPQRLAGMFMKQFENSGVPMTSELRQKIGQVISDPKVILELKNILNSATNSSE